MIIVLKAGASEAAGSVGPRLPDRAYRFPKGVAEGVTARPGVGQEHDEADRRGTEEHRPLVGDEVGQEERAVAETRASQLELSAERGRQRRHRLYRNVSRERGGDDEAVRGDQQPTAYVIEAGQTGQEPAEVPARRRRWLGRAAGRAVRGHDVICDASSWRQLVQTRSTWAIPAPISMSRPNAMESTTSSSARRNVVSAAPSSTA